MNLEFSATEFVLSSTIQVGIAIAGFTGIVLAVKSKNKLRRLQKILISILLISSIAAVVFSFIPMLLLSASISESNTWALCSAVFLVYFIGIIIYRRYQFRKTSTDIPTGIQILISLFATAAVLQIPNIFYLKAAWPYLILLIIYILYSFSVFVQLLWLFWEE